MMKSPKDTKNGFRPLSCFVMQPLTLLLIAIFLNSRETQGIRIFSGTSGKNDIFSSILPGATDTSSAPTPFLNTSAKVTSNKPTLEENTPDPYEPYMKSMTSPLGDYDLEFSLDFYDEKNLLKEYDFDPVNLVNKLADSAITHNTPPNSFMEEIQDLISLQNRSRSEPDDSPVRDEVSQLNSGILSDNLRKRMAEGWKNELKRLEKKYNVSAKCTGPDSITPSRLALMFPHYLNFGQRPFAVAPEISLHLRDYYYYKTTTTTTTTTTPAPASCLQYDDYGECDVWGLKMSDDDIPIPDSGSDTNNVENDYKVPAFFKRVEFGGMIPLYSGNNSIRSYHRDALIGLHLYVLYGREQSDVIPFRTKCVMLRRRMQRCVLSDKRRIRFLVNNDLSSENGASYPVALGHKYRSLPSEFTSIIDWNIFDFGKNPPTLKSRG